MTLIFNHQTESIQAGSGILSLSSNPGALILPQSGSSGRPVTPIAAMIRYNTDSSVLEFYNGTTWLSTSGSNPVSSGGSSTNLAIATFNGTTGLTIQSSPGTLDNSGNLSGLASITVPQINATSGSNLNIGAAGTQSIILTPGTAGNLQLINNFWPPADGSAGYALVTSGSRQLSFSQVSAPGLQGIFQYTSGSVVTLNPKNGNKVVFPSGVTTTIPSSGISSTRTNASINGTAAQTLGNSSSYYAYLWYNGTSYIIDWSFTGWTVDTTSGLAIKNGDPTRLLIGFVYTTSGGLFSDTTSIRTVLSYYNRKHRTIVSTASLSGQTATGTAYTNLLSTNQVTFCTWADDSVHISANAIASVSSAGQSAGVNIGIDNTTPLAQAGQMYSASPGQYSGLHTDLDIFLNEGAHTAVMLGNASGGTATFSTGLLSGFIVG